MKNFLSRYTLRIHHALAEKLTATSPLVSSPSWWWWWFFFAPFSAPANFFPSARGSAAGPCQSSICVREFWRARKITIARERCAAAFLLRRLFMRFFSRPELLGGCLPFFGPKASFLRCFADVSLRRARGELFIQLCRFDSATIKSKKITAKKILAPNLNLKKGSIVGQTEAI